MSHISAVYGLSPEVDFDENVRVEFSVRPIRLAFGESNKRRADVTKTPSATSASAVGGYRSLLEEMSRRPSSGRSRDGFAFCLSLRSSGVTFQGGKFVHLLDPW